MSWRASSVRMRGVGEETLWSGQSFDEEGLASEGRFKAGEVRNTADQADPVALVRWLAKAHEIQWDYRNLVRCTERLERPK